MRPIIRKYSKQIERNILSVYARATDAQLADGISWYFRARIRAMVISEKYSVSIRKVVGVIAALSPGNEFERNMREAEAFIDAVVNKKALPNVGVYGRHNTAKALKIMHLTNNDPITILNETGRAPKVSAFYKLIMNPCDTLTVCVDRHTKAVALNIKEPVEQDKKTAVKLLSEYQWLSVHYRNIAPKVGLLPNQLQAVCWVVWRSEGGDND